MTQSSFTEKIIETRLTLAQGSFGDNGATKIIRGLATEVTIEKVGLPGRNKASVRIYGLTKDDMVMLSRQSFRPLESEKNLIAIWAGDENDMTQVFAGEINQVQADLNSAPDIVFEIKAQSGYYPSLMAEGPETWRGQVPAADIIGQLTERIGYAFSNKGVSVSLRNPRLEGSPLEKIISAGKQAGIDLVVDDNEIIALPPEKPREEEAVPVSKDTGLIGYPTFDGANLSIKSIFNPRFRFDGLIEVESEVEAPNKIWRITRLTHSLAAFKTGGPWMSDITAVAHEGASGSAGEAKQMATAGVEPPDEAKWIANEDSQYMANPETEDNADDDGGNLSN